MIKQIPLTLLIFSIFFVLGGCGERVEQDNLGQHNDATNASGPTLAAPQHFSHFIRRDGHQLKDGDQLFRFAGIHAPELHRIEDDSKGVCPDDRRGWGQYFKWPSKQEQQNWIQALADSGHKAMRIYVLSVAHPDDKACHRETHILAPETAGAMPTLNEKAMRVYDQMIALAGENQLRLILPFIDHWQWWGGREQLAAFYNETADDFYDTNSKTYQAYLHIISQVVTRTNSITGVPYNQDKTIMAWETGNELKASDEAFVSNTAAHIKSLAPQQLVVDGNYLSILPSSLDDPNVDIISNHFYTVNDNNKPQTIIDDLTAIAGKKVYFVGEFGLESADTLERIMQTAVNADVNGAQAAGAFIWGFRGHRHDGGFYWHKEGSSGHYSYHLPGFVEGDANNERAVVDIVRTAQAQMNGLDSAPALPKPRAPQLRKITDDMDIRFMGAPLGKWYSIERSDDGQTWSTLVTNVSDGHNRFDPQTDALYIDVKTAQIGQTLYYRVTAHNESGASVPSNVMSMVYTERHKQSQLNSQFVSVNGTGFYRNGKPYYFVGANYWYGAVMAAESGDRARLRKELDHLQSIGVDNLRILVGADGGNTDSSVKPALQYEQGKYRQELFEGLDYLLAEMQKRDMLAVLYLNNNWIWSGGMSQYLAWNGYGEVPNPFEEEHSWPEYMAYTEQFHRCQSCVDAYLTHIKTVIGRTNSVTGVAYSDDPTIMSWQLANEPRVFSQKNQPYFKAWLNKSVALIEQLAPRQLISTGSEGRAGSVNSVDLFKENHNNSDIDYLTMHAWPKNWSWYDIDDEQGSTQIAIDNTTEYMAEHIAVANQLNKPIVLSEFGFPRNNESLDPNSRTVYRDIFYQSIFQHVAESKRSRGALAGLNFWAYGGFGVANNADGKWREGDDYLGDPAQEPQGLNTIFANDHSTVELIKAVNKSIQQQ